MLARPPGGVVARGLLPRPLRAQAPGRCLPPVTRSGLCSESRLENLIYLA